MRALRLQVLAALAALAACAAASALFRASPPEETVFAPPRQPSRTLAGAGMTLRAACRRAHLAYPPPSLRIVIAKRERVLGVMSGEALLKEYPVGLGRAPLGSKLRAGDGRTPEGRLYVCTRAE